MSPMFSTDLARLHQSELLRFARQRPATISGTPRRRFWRRPVVAITPRPVALALAPTAVEDRRVA